MNKKRERGREREREVVYYQKAVLDWHIEIVFWLTVTLTERERGGERERERERESFFSLELVKLYLTHRKTNYTKNSYYILRVLAGHGKLGVGGKYVTCTCTNMLMYVHIHT